MVARELQQSRPTHSESQLCVAATIDAFPLASIRQANGPKGVLQHAYRLGWLDDEQRWLKLLEDRNLTSHAYREPLAREIDDRIPAHHGAMREAVRKSQATS
jgi:nucleotidyltransferase substrate binding protein (TIGR01987 family)